MLCCGSPGTMAGPLSPPERLDRRVRRSSPASLFFTPWQSRQNLSMIALMSRSKPSGWSTRESITGRCSMSKQPGVKRINRMKHPVGNAPRTHLLNILISVDLFRHLSFSAIQRPHWKMSLKLNRSVCVNCRTQSPCVPSHIPRAIGGQDTRDNLPGEITPVSTLRARGGSCTSHWPCHRPQTPPSPGPTLISRRGQWQC